MQILNITTSLLASSACGWRGTRDCRRSQQPERLLQFYEFEGCPYCRLVRQALTELDLDAMIYPCPKGGERWRPQATAIGGRKQFPLLVDDNTQTVAYESADIIAHLYKTYGSGGYRPATGTLAQVGANLATAVRGLAGVRVREHNRAPEHPLELYSFESSPYSRLVRETLCELEIPYILRNMGKAVGPDMGPPWIRARFFPDTPVKGRNRQRMMQKTGRLQVPFLIDPNTDTQMYESAAINRYLLDTYGRAERERAG